MTHTRWQTFPNSAVDIIKTVRLFSVNTLQYLLLTAIGFTWEIEKQGRSTRKQSNFNKKILTRRIFNIRRQMDQYILYISFQKHWKTFQWRQRQENEIDDSPVRDQQMHQEREQTRLWFLACGKRKQSCRTCGANRNITKDPSRKASECTSFPRRPLIENFRP